MVIKTVDLQTALANLEAILTMLEENTEILLVQDDKPLARILPIKTSPPLTKISLDSLLSGITSDNLHSEQDTGLVVGSEQW